MSATFGDVNASITPCTCLNGDGEPCGRPGSPRLPLGVCIDCAVRITRAALRLGGGLTTLAKEATR
jgi:hypothetical protein